MKREIRELVTVDGRKVMRCVKCNVAFTPRSRTQRFCSPTCYGRIKNDSPSKVCILCGKSYDRPKYWSAAQWDKRKYCSKECSLICAGRSQKTIWANAEYRSRMSKVHSVPKPHLRGIPNLKNRGPNNSNWKGGITPENHKIRTSLEYKTWRREVFERDGYTCVHCGAKSGRGVRVVLHADHIKPFCLYPDLRTVVSNGRTLCKDCHRETETFAMHVKKGGSNA